ncbi:hypothetical protein HJG60_007740 [Phyllostomus discolor]|uniref:Uncharacterized protein n=1 Tax=Phyllostomus discolor TaxID=89673 RepID=A0A834EY43_9CHIR|nr:hypothetical protein HJG60_007740 [Phyllostomus discolor]
MPRGAPGPGECRTRRLLKSLQMGVIPERPCPGGTGSSAKSSQNAPREGTRPQTRRTQDAPRTAREPPTRPLGLEVARGRLPWSTALLCKDPIAAQTRPGPSCFGPNQVVRLEQGDPAAWPPEHKPSQRSPGHTAERRPPGLS